MKMLLALSLLALSACSANQVSQMGLGQNDTIIGGEKALATDPVRTSTVSLIEKTNNGDLQSFCTGILISKNLVVTAAHCIVPMESKTFYVFFGEVLPTSADDKNLAEIDTATYNKDYQLVPSKDKKSISSINDIGLIRLVDKAPEGFAPAPILENSDLLKANTMMVLAGYGVVNDVTNERTKTLNYVRVPFVKSYDSFLVTDQNNGKGACFGDSGGPAYIETSKGLVAVGETHSAYDGAVDCHHFGEYTSLAKYRDYIDSEVKAMQADAPIYVTPNELKAQRGSCVRP